MANLLTIIINRLLSSSPIDFLINILNFSITMSDKFQNQYRIPSARASWWNYSQNGLYFITICTANREPILGKIVNTEMVLSSIGVIVKEEWEKSFLIRRELFCDVYVIMPNHIHAILRIDNNDKTNDGDVANDDDNANVGNGANLETHGRASLPTNEQSSFKNNCGVAVRIPKSISSFVAGFKSSATKQISLYRKMPKTPVWQTRFHDHIIRDAESYNRICQYIENNLANWIVDSLFKE
jgi:putative transposase